MSPVLKSNLAQLAKMAADGLAVCRLGIVANYDPATYSMKVTVQPNDVLTGYMPVGAMWAGPGWGMFCPPTVGNQAMVFYQEADSLVPLGGFVLFNDVENPLSVDSGEFWLVHQTGSFIKILNDGSIAIFAAEIDVTATSQVNVKAPVVNVSGNVMSGPGISGAVSVGNGGILTLQDGLVTNAF